MQPDEFLRLAELLPDALLMVSDGIIQAVEDPRQNYFIGVQWHPEYLLLSARQRRLFSALVKAARQRLRN